MRPLVAALLLLAGCETVRPCRSLTLLVTVTLDTVSATADQIEVDVTLDGTLSKTNQFGHVPNDPRGTVELDFPAGYPVHHVAAITARALAAGNPIGAGSAALELPDDCGTLQVDVHGGP